MNGMFQKWHRQYKRDYQTVSWLRCELNRDKTHVAPLYCEVCQKYVHSVQSLRNFSRVWMTGSTNLKCSNVVDDATSNVHKVAMVKKKADCMKASGQSVVLSSPIGRSLANLDDETRARVRHKFDVCYMMAKESLPYSTNPALLQLAAHHGVDLGCAYSTTDSAELFTSFIAKFQCQTFLDTLLANFFSF